MSDPEPPPPPEYVDVIALTELLYPTLPNRAEDNRIETAVWAANALVAQWTAQDEAGTPAPVGPVTRQVALELANTLWRRQPATGGLVDLDALVARLPADLVRGLRDELDAVTGVWGLA